MWCYSSQKESNAMKKIFIEIKELFNEFKNSVIGMNSLYSRLSGKVSSLEQLLFSGYSDKILLYPTHPLYGAESPHIDNSITSNENTEIKAAKPTKEVKVGMPPKYSDGSFRQKRNGLEYRFMYIDNLTGEKIRKSVCGKNEQDCFNKRTEWIAGKPKKAVKSVHITGDWFKKWYATYKIRKDGSKINPTNEKYIDRYILPKFGKLPLKLLTGLQIQDFLKEFDDRTNTRKKLADLINSCLESAVDNDLIKKNPFRSVKIEKHKSQSFNVIQPAEQNLLLQKIKNPKYLALFWFCCCSGLRISEAVTSVPYIDYEKCIINVVNADTSTKKHKRQIPFLPELISLEQRKLLNKVTINGAQRYFWKLFKELDLDFVIHSFRHTFISCCNHVGFRDKQIQEWAGHSSIVMTMDTYTHLLTNETSPIIEYFRKLKKYFDSKT